LNEKRIAGLPSREKLNFYKGKALEAFEAAHESKKSALRGILLSLDALLQNMELTTPHPVLKGRRLLGLHENRISSAQIYMKGLG
jgi:hypothetical protein